MNKLLIYGVVIIAIIAGGVWFMSRDGGQPVYNKNNSGGDLPSGETRVVETLPAGTSGDNESAVSSSTVDTGSVETPSTSSSSPSSGVVPAAAGSQTQTTQAAPVKEFTISGQNFSFSPASIKVKKGDRVKITFVNTSGFHDFVIDEFKVATAKINGGQQVVVEFVADRVGQFEYYCSVGSHRQSGMKGALTVE